MSASVPQDLKKDEIKEYLDKNDVLEFLTVPSSRDTMTANISQDWNNEEFKEYLDEAGALNLLTSAFAELYEEPDKPSDPLEYIKTCMGGVQVDKEEITKLSHENDDLKTKIKALQKTQVELKEKLLEDSKTTDKMEEMSAADTPGNNAAIDDTAAVVDAPAMVDCAKVNAIALVKPSMEVPNIDSLCDDLMEPLFSLLSHRDLKSTVEVCKRWKTIGEGSSLWKWVKLWVTGGNLADMPVILGLSRLAKVEEITLDDAISKEVLLAMEKHQGLKAMHILGCDVSGINADLLARVIIRIKEVELRGTNLDSKQWNAILKCMSNEAKLKKLSIEDMSLSVANPHSLAEAVITLERVKLVRCRLTTEQSKAMFDRLAVESKLKSIDIRGTDLSSVAVQSLAKVISQVEEATLYSTRLTTQQITDIFTKVTEEDSQLKVLDLGGNDLSQVDPDVIATAVNKIEKVDLSYVRLNARQCSAIIGLAAGNSKLKDLDISGNDLSSVNQHDVARAVINMKKIDLRWTALTNQQCIQIFMYTEDCTNLKVLKISDNDLSAVEPGSMAKAVCKREECSLQWSKLTSQQLEEIFKQLTEDCNLKKLSMRGVTLSSVDGNIISTAIANLYEVDLGVTRLTPQQLEAVFMAIKSGRKLKVLRLWGADLRSVQIESLVGVLSR